MFELPPRSLFFVLSPRKKNNGNKDKIITLKAIYIGVGVPLAKRVSLHLGRVE
jgi:hypothetical protein